MVDAMLSNGLYKQIIKIALRLSLSKETGSVKLQLLAQQRHPRYKNNPRGREEEMFIENLHELINRYEENIDII